jgi:hypothetical protein
MKTQLLYAAALLIAGGLWSCQKAAVEPDASAAGITKTTTASGSTAITTNIKVNYQVTVLQAEETDICGNYVVEVTDRNGNLVAPPQPYSQDNSVYIFTENTNNPTGVRMARLLLDNSEDGACPNILYSAPDIKKLYLVDGKTIFFTLKPALNPPANPN